MRRYQYFSHLQRCTKALQKFRNVVQKLLLRKSTNSVPHTTNIDDSFNGLHGS
jgi:hypothetical protein